MKNKLLPIIIMVIIFFSFCSVEYKNENKWQQIDALFSQWAHSDSPGCALGIIDGEELIYTRGYGMADLNKTKAIDEHSIFDIASTSKQFTAMSIAILEEEGKLNIEDDVRFYIPELTRYDKIIRIRHLIYHTSGLPDYLQWATASDSEETILQKLRDKLLTHEVGQKYEYTNTGYLLLGFIVRRITGKTLRQYAEERIFQPLGMAETFFNDDISQNSLIPNLAIGYWEPKENIFFEYMPPINLVGNSGVNTNVSDLNLWNRNFYHNCLGKRKQSLIERLLTAGKLDNGEPIGENYAWGLVIGSYHEHRMVSHAGRFYGYRADLIRLPDDKLTVIVLANLAECNPTPLALKVVDILMENRQF